MAGANYAGNALAQDRALTLNERLNKVAEAMAYQCERIESVLNRVHGNPTPIRGGGGETAPKVPTMPMATITEHLEAVLQRLQDAATSVERIA